MGVEWDGWDVGRGERGEVGSTRGIGGWQWNACIFMNIDEASRVIGCSIPSSFFCANTAPKPLSLASV